MRAKKTEFEQKAAEKLAARAAAAAAAATASVGAAGAAAAVVAVVVVAAAAAVVVVVAAADETAELRASFDQLDTNKSGKLSRAEIEKLLKQMGEWRAAASARAASRAANAAYTGAN